MWAYESVFYQIYPLGFCGAPFENDGVLTSRILKVIDWIPHMQKLGVNAIYFSPVFESDTHGYNTRDYTKIDCRLGTNEDFKTVCDALHEASASCSMPSSTMSAAASGHFRMCLRIVKIPVTRTGLQELPLTVTLITMTACGMKAGRVIMI